MENDILAYALIFGLFFYLFPYFIARARDHHKKTGIFWINLLLGWSGLVWIILLIYSIFSSAFAPEGDEKRGFN